MFKYEVNLWDTLIEVCYMGDTMKTLDEAQVAFLAAWDSVYLAGDEHIFLSMDVIEYDDQGNFVAYV